MVRSCLSDLRATKTAPMKTKSYQQQHGCLVLFSLFLSIVSLLSNLNPELYITFDLNNMSIAVTGVHVSHNIRQVVCTVMQVSP